jgi:hypothetical protein
MTPEDNKRIFYIRAILRNRLAEHSAVFWDEEKALRYLRNAVERGATVSNLEEHAKKAVNWSSFFNPIRDALDDELYGYSEFPKT